MINFTLTITGMAINGCITFTPAILCEPEFYEWNHFIFINSNYSSIVCEKRIPFALFAVLFNSNFVYYPKIRNDEIIVNGQIFELRQSITKLPRFLSSLRMQTYMIDLSSTPKSHGIKFIWPKLWSFSISFEMIDDQRLMRRVLNWVGNLDFGHRSSWFSLMFQLKAMVFLFWVFPLFLCWISRLNRCINWNQDWNWFFFLAFRYCI